MADVIVLEHPCGVMMASVKSSGVSCQTCISIVAIVVGYSCITKQARIESIFINKYQVIPQSSLLLIIPKILSICKV